MKRRTLLKLVAGGALGAGLWPVWRRPAPVSRSQPLPEPAPVVPPPVRPQPAAPDLAERIRRFDEDLPADTPMTLRQYIDIPPDGDPAAWPLEVALAVPAIDAPTVFKTIIMIHNYKRLAPGRHEYGPGHRFPAD